MEFCCICLKIDCLDSSKGRGVISPWIRQLTGITQFKTTLRRCTNCNGSFFEYRYSEENMISIYKDYRGSMYTSIRKYWEPWYSGSYNDVDKESLYTHERRRILKNFLNEQRIYSAKTIVDVGGNVGEFIPELDGLENRYVLEISEKELPSNIRRIRNLEEVTMVDLIMYAHVLEHVSNPFRELEKLIENCKYLYVEVPNGTPAFSLARRSRMVQVICILLAKSPTIWRRITRASWGRKKPMSILRQAEHQNFFTEDTFSALGKKLGVSVSTKVNNIVAPDGLKSNVIQVLFHQN